MELARIHESGSNMFAVHWKKGAIAKCMPMMDQPFRNKEHLRSWAMHQGIKGTVRVFEGSEIRLHAVI